MSKERFDWTLLLAPFFFLAVIMATVFFGFLAFLFMKELIEQWL